MGELVVHILASRGTGVRSTAMYRGCGSKNLRASLMIECVNDRSCKFRLESLEPGGKTLVKEYTRHHGSLLSLLVTRPSWGQWVFC